MAGNQMRIGNKLYSKQRCLIVAEVAQSHDGSLGMAHAFIDAAAASGADAVKFQTHIAAAESTPAEPWRVRFSKQDATRYDYWKRMEFSEEQWKELKIHAEKKGLLFLSSPFSLEAIKLLTKIGIKAWKVASGEALNPFFLDQLLLTKLPILLSTGMSSIAEVDGMVKRIKAKKVPLCVLQCNSTYPCPPEKVGLNLIPYFRDRYRCAVGLSDHSGKIYPGLAAAALGANVIEVHIALSRSMFGPDVPVSLIPDELKQLVDGVHFIEKMNANPLDKNKEAKNMKRMRDLFTKSIVAACDLPAGMVLREKHLVFKKPGTGIAPSKIREVLGKKLKCEIKADQMIHKGDLKNNDR